LGRNEISDIDQVNLFVKRSCHPFELNTEIMFHVLHVATY